MLTRGLSLALHLFALLVVPLAHEPLEASERVVHIEATREAPCAPVHDESACQTWRVAEAARTLSRSGGEIRVALSLRHTDVLPPSAAPAAGPSFSPLAPRAPPVL